MYHLYMGVGFMGYVYIYYKIGRNAKMMITIFYTILDILYTTYI